MFNLKTTLGKGGSDAGETPVSRVGAGRHFQKGKKASIWAIDPEQEEGGEQKEEGIEKQVLEQFQKQLLAAYQKDPSFTEMAFYEIVGPLHAAAPDLEEVQYLAIVHDNAQRGLSEEGDESYQLFVANLHQCLARRIRKLKKKDKMGELQEYQKIIKDTFKKKSAQLIEEDIGSKELHMLKNLRKNSDNNNGSTCQLDGSNSGSTEGKLGLLLGKPKEGKKAEGNGNKEESISFSTMINNNMTVRQRHPREKKRDKKELAQPHLARIKSEEDGNNDAFIFYRPKAAKNR